MSTSKGPGNNNDLLLMILQAVGLLFVFLGSYLGLNYIFSNQIFAGLGAVFIVFLEFLLIGALIQQKRKSRHQGFQVIEGLLILSFVVLVFLAAIPIFHFSNLDFFFKSAIQKETEQRFEFLEAKFPSFKNNISLRSAEVKTKGEKFIDNARQLPSFTLTDLADSLARFEIPKDKLGGARPLEDAKDALDNKLYLDTVVAFKKLSSSLEEFEEARTEIWGIVSAWNRNRLPSAYQRIGQQEDSVGYYLMAAYNELPKYYHNSELSDLVAKEFDRSEYFFNQPMELIKKNEAFTTLLQIAIYLILQMLIISLYLFKKREGMRYAKRAKHGISVK